MALVLLTAIVAFRGLPEQGFAGWFPWAMLAGVSGAMGLLSFYAALSTGTMGVVAPIAAVGSGIPVLLGVLSGEKPSALAWWGIAVAIAGVVLASGPEMKEGLGARPVLLACLAAVGFGVALFALDRGARVSLLHTLWGMRITSAIGYAALALAARSLGGVARRQVPVLAAGNGYCVGKAALYAAACRAVGVPARVGFADVRNHLSTEKLTESMGTDLFAWHGFTEVFLDEEWRKASPTFNDTLCAKLGVSVLDFDGAHDSLLHPYDGAGRAYMRYERQHGAFADVPAKFIGREMKRVYGHMYDADHSGRDMEKEAAGA